MQLQFLSLAEITCCERWGGADVRRLLIGSEHTASLLGATADINLTPGLADIV